MDFTKFDTVSAAEKGAEMHLLHPVSLEPLYDNKNGATVKNNRPCIVILQGAESAAVREAYREAQKENAASDSDGGDENADSDVVLLEDLHRSLVDAMLPRVVGFKNVHKGDKPAEAADAEWFFNLNRVNGRDDEKSFVEQAAEFSSKRASYLGNGLTG